MINKLRNKLKTTLLKNFFKYSFATLFEKLILMVVFFYTANLFGPEKYGEIAYTISILTLFSILGVLGLDTYGHREISKNKKKVAEIVSNHIFFKFFLFFLVEIIIYLYTTVFEESLQIKLLIITYSLVIFFDIFNLEWVSRGLEQYEPVVISKIVSSLVLIGSIFVVLNKSSDNIYFIFIFIFLFKLISGFIYLLNFRYLFNYRFISIEYLQKAFLPSITLMASYFMMTIYYHIDKVMLGNFFDKSYVGMYDVAYKIFGIFVILNTLLWAIFSSRISRRINLKEYKVIMLSSGFVLFILMLFSSELIIEYFFNSSYVSILLPLQLLSFNIIFVFLNSTFVSPLMLWNKENIFFYLTIIGALSNIILNYILIPLYDMSGAAVATIASEIIILFTALLFRKKVYN